jgi:hypothetical protein
MSILTSLSSFSNCDGLGSIVLTERPCDQHPLNV